MAASDDPLLRYYERVALSVQAEATTRNYLDLGQLAFATCVHSFAHADVTAKEAKCIAAVARKHMAASLRASARFAEAQSERARADRAERERALAERGALGEPAPRAAEAAAVAAAAPR